MKACTPIKRNNPPITVNAVQIAICDIIKDTLGQYLNNQARWESALARKINPSSHQCERYINIVKRYKKFTFPF